jgi:hypothetical protein
VIRPEGGGAPGLAAGRVPAENEAGHRAGAAAGARGESVPARDKLLLRFEPHTRIIPRFKAGKLAADRGMSSAGNQELAKQAGVKQVALPRVGKAPPERRERKKERWFRRGYRFRVIDDRRDAGRAVVQLVGGDVPREVGQRPVEVLGVDPARRLFPPRPRPSSGSWPRGRRRDDPARGSNWRPDTASRPR